MYRTIAAIAWVAALVTATLGFAAGRAVFDRGVAYGPPPALPDVSLPRRAVNTQLELEPDRESVRRSLSLIKAAGFGWIRQQFAWDAIETSSKGRYDWTRADALVDAASEAGVDVLARLDLPPEWARPPASYKTHPPRDVRDFGDFVAAFTRRYAGRVRYVQLWNEPNLNEEWGRRAVDPAGYVELLRAGYEGAKRGNPAVRVLSGALAQTLEPDDPSASGLDDLVYLDRLYLAGAAPYFDVLAANAYGLATGPDDRRASAEQANFPRLLLVRDVMLRHGDAGKAVWVAEFGWNALPRDWSGEPSPWGQVPPERQAAYIVGAYERAATEWPWLGPMALWLFRRPHADARDPTPFFALVDGDWQPRPAYDALAQTAERQPLTVGAHQESSPLLDFEGLWQWTPDAAAQLGELRESPISGAAVRWRFRGTQVDLVAPVGPARGTAFVKVNGAYTLANRLPLNPNGQAVVDFYAPTGSSQARIALASGLPDRVHEVELVVTGDLNPASTGAGVGIDAIVVSRARPTLPAIALGGAWGASALAAAWLLLRRRAMAVPVVAALADGAALRGAVLATAASLPFAPLAIRTPLGSYSPVEMLALLAITLWFARLFLGAARGARFGAFALPAAMLIVAGIVSTLAADYPRLALRELRTLVVEPALFSFAARSVLRGPRDGMLLAASFLAGAAAASALAVLQTVTGRGLVAAEGVTRAAALYRSPNNLALLLDRAVPLATAGALSIARPARWFFVVTLALCGAALFFSFSRGAWLATAVALFIVAIPAARSAFRRRRLVVALAVVAPVVLAGATALALRVDRFRSLFSAAGTGFLRFHLWIASVRMALDHPVLGVGLDQFLYHYPRYMLPEAWREPNLSHPHQLVLDFWLRLGVIGLAALVAAGVALGGRLRLRPYTSAGETLRRGAFGAVIALVVHGLVDNSYFLIDLAYATWIVLLLAELAVERDAPHAEATV